MPTRFTLARCAALAAAAGGAAPPGGIEVDTVLPRGFAAPGSPKRRAPPRHLVPATVRRLNDASACDVRHFEIPADADSADGGHAGSEQNPIVLESGCPATVDVARGTHAFLLIPGFNETDDRGDRPMLRWEWSVDEAHDEAPFVGFSFSEAFPRYEGMSHRTFFDWCRGRRRNLPLGETKPVWTAAVVLLPTLETRV